MAARFKEKYLTEIRPAIAKELGITNAMAIPEAREDRHQHGSRRSHAERQDHGPAGRRSRLHRRPEACHHQGQEVHRGLQGARRHAHRRDGHAARRQDVRVPRPPDLDRSAPRARLPRRLVEELRRPRQLHARPARPAHLRRDRLREGGQAQGHERHHRHHRRRTTTAPAPCSRALACRSGSAHKQSTQRSL